LGVLSLWAYDGKHPGIYLREDGRGTYEENKVSGNAFAGVCVRQRGIPTVRRNKITGNGYQGVSLRDEGGGTFEDNDLRQHAWPVGHCGLSASEGQAGT
jgi:parallel beta-helix repeat protein